MFQSSDGSTPKYVAIKDSPSKTPSNGANFNGSSSAGNFVQNETTTFGVDENCQTIEGKHHLEHPTQTSTVSWTSEKSPSSSIFSRSFFIWFDQFVHWGQEKNLLSNNDDQAWNLDDEARACTVTERWKSHEKAQRNLFMDPKRNATLRLIYKLTRQNIQISAVLEVLRIIFLLTAPQVLRQVLAYLEEKDRMNILGEQAVQTEAAREDEQILGFEGEHHTHWYGLRCILLLVSLGFFSSMCETHTYYQLNLGGIKMKTALISAVYRKSLKMLQPNESDVVNLISVDCPNLQKAFRFLHFPWSCPLQIVISLYFLYDILDEAVIPGILVLAIIVGMSIYLTLRMRTVQALQLQKKDCRIQRIFETLINLKVLKLHVWESTFERIVGLLRLDELVSIRSFITLQAFQGFVWNSAISLVAFASFSTYSVLHPQDKAVEEGQSSLNAQTVFVSIALLNAMRSAFRLMPSCVTAFSQSAASIKRIDDFLNSNVNLAPKYSNSFTKTGRTGNGHQKSYHTSPNDENGMAKNDTNGVVSTNGLGRSESIKVSKHTAIVLKDCEFAMNETTSVMMENDKKSISPTKDNVTNGSSNNITNGYCSVERPLQPSLSKISMCVQKGEIVGIVGAMASGKSTLVSALMGELTKIKGTFAVTDKLINVPNVPWLKSGTIRDNILFGSSDCENPSGSNEIGYGETHRRPKLYEKIIRECGLLEDLQRLPDGDLSWVEPKGDNLSGGQKQRISLARAVFQNASIYLLDDPLSAVDPSGRQRIFNQVIGNRGLLRRKTRILITKEERFLQHTDYIIVMKDRTIIDTGTYEELNARQAITECLLADDGGIEDDDAIIEETVGQQEMNNQERKEQLRKERIAKRLRRMDSVGKILENSSFDHDVDMPYSGAPYITARRQSSYAIPTGSRRISLTPATSIAIGDEFPMAATYSQTNNKYDQIEDLSYDNVNRQVYMYYADALGIGPICIALIFYVAYQIFEVASKLWLSEWASTKSHKEIKENKTQGETDYITIYGLLGLLQSTAFLTAILLVNQRTLSASLKLHNSIFRKVLRSTIDFVWSTPVGQIGNRFSKDMDETDVILPNTFKNFVNQCMRIGGTLFIVQYTYPSITFVVFPLSLAVIWVLKTYITTSRLMRRMSAASMSVVNAHLAETIAGVSTIRAYKLQWKMIQECMKVIDDHQTYYYLEMVSDCWLFIRLQFISSVFIGILGVLTIFHRNTGQLEEQPSGVGADMAGLSLTSAITITQDVFLFARYAACLEKAMVSVERIKDYEEITQEVPEEDIPYSSQSPTQWTTLEATSLINSNRIDKMALSSQESCDKTETCGDNSIENNHQVSNNYKGPSLSFDNLTSRYPGSQGADAISLRNVSFSLYSGEKIGVVGRTGAGKSSLVLALYRLLEQVEGEILFDGVDINSIKLERHRSRITIIPQETALFTGTLRFNLDPEGKVADHQIWSYVRDAKLKPFLDEMTDGLDTLIQPSGNTLSNGEQKVICCIRGLIRDSRWIILDEPTSALSTKMEELVLSAFWKRFSQSTLLMITHNLENVIGHCEKVLVLDRGKVREFDTPNNLLKKENSMFYSMAKDSGLV